MDKINWFKVGFQLACGWMVAQCIAGVIVLGFMAMAGAGS